MDLRTQGVCYCLVLGLLGFNFELSEQVHLQMFCVVLGG